jgi:quercetin dioxygenase-like cupin family protein
MHIPDVHWLDGPLLRGTPDAEAVEALGARIRFLVSGPETGGAWSLLEYAAPPGFPGPTAHYHVRTTELFYVLEGELLLETAQGTRSLGPGDLGLLPPRAVHRFSAGAGGCRFLVHLSPAGMEGYFRELAELIRGSESWPPAETRPVMALAERYDTYTPRIG